ncbi:IclR family transcriptional regulator [Bradyrhizobium liaoningense]
MPLPSNVKVTKSARRVLDILEYFDEAKRPLSLKEVCDKLGYPGSSGVALLKTLVHLGYLEYDKTSWTYLPTMKIALLGAWVPDGLFSRMSIIPTMERLRDRSGETVFLGTRSDLYTQYVHVVHSARDYGVTTGSIQPLARTGIGHLFLSLLADRDLETMIRRLNFAEPDRSLRVTHSDILRSVRKIRRQGYVFGKGLLRPGGAIIAVLLPVAPFNRTLALGFGGTTKRLEANTDRYLQMLQDAVESVRVASTGVEPFAR